MYLLFLQQKFFFIKDRLLNFAISGNARKHQEIKLGALKYRIDALENSIFRKVNRANLNSQFIREEAERLFIKNLREKVFLHKKLIVVPRPRK